MSSVKYYRVKQNTFLWAEGAILGNSQENGYSPISDIWNTDANENNEYITSQNIENNPDWFERVYEANALGKITYVTKEKARELANQFFGGKNGKSE